MPEYLAPGVYIEETSYRAKSIEGVSTSTAGFIGAARFGPVSGTPELLTSFADFARIYGGLDDLTFDGKQTTNYLAHGVRAFFEEGGKRLFVMRVFGAGSDGFALDANGIPTQHYAKVARRDDQATDPSPVPFRLIARFPGAAGNIRVAFQLVVGDNVLSRDPLDPAVVNLTRVQDYDLVHVRSRSTSTADYTHYGSADGLRVVHRRADGGWQLVDPGATPKQIDVNGETFPVGGPAVAAVLAAARASATATPNNAGAAGTAATTAAQTARTAANQAATAATNAQTAANNAKTASDNAPNDQALRKAAIDAANAAAAAQRAATAADNAADEAEKVAQAIVDAATANATDAAGAVAAGLKADNAAAAGVDAAAIQIRPIQVRVGISRRPPNQLVFGPTEVLGTYNVHPRSLDGLLSSFTANPENRLAALTIPFAFAAINGLTDELDDTVNTAALAIVRAMSPATVLSALLGTAAPAAVTYTLTGGDDGAFPGSGDYAGKENGFTDYLANAIELPKNGLLAFEAVEDISIVAAPGCTAQPIAAERPAIQGAVINHCERMLYRIAVLDTPKGMLPTEALAYRNQRSSKYAAIYYPWVVVADPNVAGRRLALPPSGFVAGIYARKDVQNAVFKAPANEVVRLAVDFEVRLNKAQQELLNPNGVNCFRFFEGRGYLLWGARTISDDPEWKYVNLRRYFAYLERSTDKGTQWAVFQNNSEQLWGNIRRTIEDFLYNEWRMGGLLGDKPEKAFFVRCDQSTMTQNDLDNGRLICLVGIAPVRPAEFVIFRIGQWTATSPR
jgi:phage tail sheath protein FI